MRTSPSIPGRHLSSERWLAYETVVAKVPTGNTKYRARVWPRWWSVWDRAEPPAAVRPRRGRAMVISGRMVQSRTQRAEAKVEREVRRSSRDLLLPLLLPPSADFDEEEADIDEADIDFEEVGGGP